jgi:5-formyltetrahydrofolate cyclo-ligase
MSTSGLAVAMVPFPVAGRIPNFQGAEQAAARAAALPEWQRARRLKCNPDAPQRARRLRALREGTVFVAVPRLTDVADDGAAADEAQTYGRTRSPKSLIASMILSCAGPPECAWRRRSRNVPAPVAVCQR